jgi:hypothetical protein
MTDEPHTIVPAPSGWYVAYYIEAGKNEKEEWQHHFSLDAIIAWEITSDACHYVTPITADGAAVSANVKCIKTPDNRFNFIEDCDFDNEAEALTHAQRKHEHRQQQKRAAK